MSMQLDPSRFDAEVKESAVPVIVDFNATWCGPCKLLAPTMEKVARDYESRAKVFSMDVDGAQALATSFGIRGVPTLIFFKGGKEADRLSGNVPYELISKKLDNLL